MSFAQNYTPTVGFATEETNSVAGRSIVRTVAVDNELANISSSINGLNTNLKAIQRDDGKLKDGLIEPYALSEQSRALIASGGTPRGSWLSGQVYAIGDAVVYASTSYLCVIPHTSTVSFDAGLWMAISGDGSSFVSAAASALSASQSLTYANLAGANAIDSSNSAASASSSATTASGNAAASANSAASAAASASQAQSIISNNIAGASQSDAETGTDNAKYMTSLRVKQSILFNVPASFAPGTRMLFNQTAAPTGWTKDTTAALNDSIMRIVTGTVGNGGSTAFSTFNGQTSTAAYTLTIADMPNHAHNEQIFSGGAVVAAQKNSGGAGVNQGIATTTFSTTAGILTTLDQGSGGAHSHGMTTSIKYNDFIIASKN